MPSVALRVHEVKLQAPKLNRKLQADLDLVQVDEAEAHANCATETESAGMVSTRVQGCHARGAAEGELHHGRTELSRAGRLVKGQRWFTLL